MFRGGVRALYTRMSVSPRLRLELQLQHDLQCMNQEFAQKTVLLENEVRLPARLPAGLGLIACPTPRLPVFGPRHGAHTGAQCPLGQSPLV